MIIKAFFIALVACCYMQTSNAADIGYGLVCAAGVDVCTAAGTACLDDSGSKKCVCDPTKHWIANQEKSACVCDAAGHWVANQGNTACVCDAAKFWQLDSGSNSCKCAPTYVLDGSTCRGTIDSTVCKASGSECSTATDSYCDATALKCKCPAITTAATNICTYKVCKADAVCTVVDPNSECSGTTDLDKCRCKTGYRLGSDGLCAVGGDGGGAAGLLVSMSILLACLLATLS